MDKCYTEIITKQIPEFIAKYCILNDKGLIWEMIKMEIRPSAIIFAKNKAKQKWNEEKDLLMRLNQLQEKLRSSFSEAKEVEMDWIKIELAKIVNKKTRGAKTRGAKATPLFFHLLSNTFSDFELVGRRREKKSQ